MRYHANVPKRKQDTGPQPVDHLGLWLARAYHAFKREMLARLHNAGFDDLTPLHLLMLPRVPRDGIGMAALIETLGMSKQAVSRGLREMVAAGYVELAPDPSDKRAKVVSLGPRGVALGEASKPIKKRMHSRMRADLGADVLVELSRALEQVEVSFDRGAAEARDE